MPVKRCGSPLTLRARRNGSASALLRTRMARSRGRWPRAIRSSMSAATTSASAETVSRWRWRTAGPVRRAERRRLSMPRDDLEPVRVVVGDEPGGGVEDHLGRAVVLGEHHLARLRVEAAEGQQVRRRRSPPAIDGLVVVADHRDVGPVRRRRAGAPAPAGRGSCPGTRRPGRSDSARAASPGRRDARAAARGRAWIWSPKSTAPGLREQRLVGRVERRQLEVALRLVLVLRRRREVASAPPPRPDTARARRPRPWPGSPGRAAPRDAGSDRPAAGSAAAGAARAARAGR